jgi:hypothetical protein
MGCDSQYDDPPTRAELAERDALRRKEKAVAVPSYESFDEGGEVLQGRVVMALFHCYELLEFTALDNNRLGEIRVDRPRLYPSEKFVCKANQAEIDAVKDMSLAVLGASEKKSREILDALRPYRKDEGRGWGKVNIIDTDIAVRLESYDVETRKKVRSSMSSLALENYIRDNYQDKLALGSDILGDAIDHNPLLAKFPEEAAEIFVSEILRLGGKKKLKSGMVINIRTDLKSSAPMERQGEFAI